MLAKLDLLLWIPREKWDRLRFPGISMSAGLLTVKLGSVIALSGRNENFFFKKNIPQQVCRKKQTNYVVIIPESSSTEHTQRIYGKGQTDEF